MPDDYSTPVPPSHRTAATLLAQAAQAPTLAEQRSLVAQAEQARSDVFARERAARELDLSTTAIADTLTPVPVHELHTASTDWLGEVATGPTDVTAMTNHVLAKATVWYSNLPVPVKVDNEEFKIQATGYAQRLAGQFGTGAQIAENAFIQHIATLRNRDERAGMFGTAAGPSGGPPMPGRQGDPEDTFTTGGGQDWLPPEATSSNRAPQLQEIAAESPTQANDPGVNANAPDPGVQAQEQADGGISPSRTAALARPVEFLVSDHTGAVGPTTVLARTAAQIAQLDDSPWAVRKEALDIEEKAPTQPKCAKCGNPVAPAEMAHTAANEVVHGVCPGAQNEPTTVTPAARVAHLQEGSTMQQAPCPTCGIGVVAVREAPLPSIRQLVAGPANPRHAYSGLDEIQQVVDPSDTQVRPTPLPEEVAFPWNVQPGQVENTIGEAEQQIAEREQRKGAALYRQAAKAAQIAHAEVLRRGGGRHVAMQAAAEASRLVYLGAMQDDSGWAGDMGQSGYQPSQQDGGNPPSTNLGAPDPVYGYGGDNPSQPLKPYGADEANDETNRPSTWQPGQPTQMDMASGMGQATTGPGGMGPAMPNPPVTKQSAIDSDPEIQRALAYVRNRRVLLENQQRAS